MSNPFEIVQKMAQWSYTEWYEKDVAPHLSKQEKETVMRRISDLTLEAAIWLDRKTNFIDQFPELKPYSHSGSISGLQLVSVMEAIFKEFYPAQAAKLPFP